MSKKVHSLFLTRGVPGTHDLGLINKTIKKLKTKKFKTVLIPKFDKSIDDRLKKNKWQKIKNRPNIIIFEGWCVGARHQKDSELKNPLNPIEKKYDLNLVWRRTVNYYLKNQYKKLFNKLDKLIYLKAPDFDWVFRWRLHQEEKMKLTSKDKKIMSKSEVRNFIMYYERLTKHMMRDLKNISDLTIYLDTKHRSKKMKFY